MSWGCSMSTMTVNLREASEAAAFGLESEAALHVHRLLRDYDHHLSLRKLQEGEPAFREGRKQNPPLVYGVHEETAISASPYVFLVSEVSLGNPAAILARVAMGDATKYTVAERMEFLKRSHTAAELAERKRFEEEQAARIDEAKFIASTQKSRIRHKIDGDDVIIGDETRSARTHV